MVPWKWQKKEGARSHVEESAHERSEWKRLEDAFADWQIDLQILSKYQILG